MGGILIQESKEETFRRLATQRTNAVLERIRILGNCSNTSNYRYTQDEVSKIFAAIRKELDLTEGKFRGSLNRRLEFKL